MFEERRRPRFSKTLLSVLLVVLLIGGALYYGTNIFDRRSNPGQQIPQVQQGNDVPRPQQLASEQIVNPASVATAVARSASPGVVGISVLRVDGNTLFDRNAQEKWGVGSGVIASPNGYILTNNHVAGGKSKRLVVSLADGRNIDGVCVWAEPVLDLAVVKINQTNLPTIPLGDANTLQVGDPAIAIGNPLGLQFQRTVTSGIISALNRTIKIDTEQGSNFMEDLIQTDASINPGNSGGPLLDARGRVVGINTIKVTSAESIGFAIPINVAIPILQKFLKDGEFNEPYLGVFAYDREVIPYLDGNFKLDKGIYVSNVDEAGPARKSGIHVGCIITQVDGQDIRTMLQLRTYIYSKNPGDTVRLTHVKGNKVENVDVRLAAKEKPGLLTR
ncbi:MAG: trypsin-like peptidase domain-containing protein [Clostridia bacterium]|nr:trypsin-like peptidase domain-containing protein [Clostridia bacterium]